MNGGGVVSPDGRNGTGQLRASDRWGLYRTQDRPYCLKCGAPHQIGYVCGRDKTGE